MASRQRRPGTMRERPPGSGHWQLRAFSGVDGTSGKPTQVSRTFVGNERAAAKALAALVTEVEAGIVDRATVTLDQLLDAWLDHVRPTHSPKTVHEYERWIRARIKPALGHVRLDKLGFSELDSWYRKWLAAGLSESSVHHLHAILSAALNTAERWRWIANSPARRASPPPLRSISINTPTPEQLSRLYLAARDRDSVLATAVALAALTGARRGELCALRWSDVDLTTGRIRVARSLRVVSHQLLEGPTKTHQTRFVALDDVATRVLRERWTEMTEIARAVGSELAEDSYVLSRDPVGAEPIDPNLVTTGFTAVCRGLERVAAKANGGKLASKDRWQFRFHDLRHFSVTTLIAAGIDVRTVAERHGHAQATMTLNRYAHALPERDRQAAAILGRSIGIATEMGSTGSTSP